MIKKVLIIFASGFLLLLWWANWQVNLPILIALVYSVTSIVSFTIYGLDKHASVQQRSRVSERSLHILGLIGGWPGALIAQQWLRHKSQKRAFIIVLWLTIMVNCSAFAAWYYLQML
ncbi:DUF1294 domain-containing protein [Pseudoalteromonas mariniglutinosa]|uniref:DUF1294 domain-containing protein n=1 Tax=Pseudoalteromonas mariniglutinosa TaxID=206042 RepID=UPI00384D9DEA